MKYSVVNYVTLTDIRPAKTRYLYVAILSAEFISAVKMRGNAHEP